MSESTETGGLVERLRDRAESYRMGGPSSEHTAAILDEAASALASERAAHAETKARLAEAMKALEEAREVVDACAGDNRPARAWAVTVRDGIDAVLAARRVREGGSNG